LTSLPPAVKEALAAAGRMALADRRHCLHLQAYFHEKLGLPRSAVDELETVRLARRNHQHLPWSEGRVELLRQSHYAVSVVE
jgi:hypothetical protein